MFSLATQVSFFRSILMLINMMAEDVPLADLTQTTCLQEVYLLRELIEPRDFLEQFWIKLKQGSLEVAKPFLHLQKNSVIGATELFGEGGLCKNNNSNVFEGREARKSKWSHQTSLLNSIKQSRRKK